MSSNNDARATIDVVILAVSYCALQGDVVHSTPMTPGQSLYEPSDLSSPDDEVMLKQTRSRPLDPLNNYLASRDVSPVRSQPQTSWEDASAQTKWYYSRKVGQAVEAVMEDVSPNNAGHLFNEVMSLQSLHRKLSGDHDDDDTHVDDTLQETFAECYSAAGSWETRRQILSIMADKVTFKQIQRYALIYTYL